MAECDECCPVCEDPAEVEVTWEGIKQGLRHLAEERGEWAGYPLPHDRHALVLEPRFPFPKLNGYRFDDGKSELEEERERLAALAKFLDVRLSESVIDMTAEKVLAFNRMLESSLKIRNIFYVFELATLVIIAELPNGRIIHWKECNRTPVERFAMSLETSGATVDIHDVEVEFAAMNKLQELITPRACAMYFMSGQFLETSQRSGVTYVFRKLRPAVAMKDVRGVMKVLRTFCLHPIGYYKQTHTGCLCPTDDVIAHVLLMRSDERRYWAKANSHELYAPESGL